MRYNKQELIALASQTSQNFDREGVLILKERQDGFFRRSEGCSVRWFRLRGNLLFYLKGPEPWYEPTGVIVLGNHQVSVQTQDENGHWPFQIVWENGVCYRLATFHESERVLWLKAIENAPYEQYSRKIAELQKQLNETRPMIDISKFRMHNRIIHDINEVPICEMALSCDNLLCDSQGNPPSTFLAIYVLYPNDQCVRYACTESVENCSNPSFCRTIQFRASDLISGESMVRIAVYDIKESMTHTSVAMGSTTLKLNIIQEAQRLRIPLMAREEKTVGFVTINGWSLEPTHTGSPTHTKNESNSIELTPKVLSHRRSQSLPPRLGLKLKYPSYGDLIRLNFLKPYQVTYRFQSGLGGDITVHEVLAEPRFCFNIPIQLVEIFLIREKELLETMLTMTDMPQPIQSRQNEFVNIHLAVMKLYSACQKSMLKMGGFYKPSCRKEEVELGFAPVNLHLQRMWVHNDTLNKTGFHDVVTVGAFTAHTHNSEKYGGLIKLLQQLKDGTSAKAEMMANANRLNAEFEKILAMRGMRDAAVVNMDKALVAIKAGIYHKAALYNDVMVTNVKKILSLWDGPGTAEALTKVGWCWKFAEARSKAAVKPQTSCEPTSANGAAIAGDATPSKAENPDSVPASLPEGANVANAGASEVSDSGTSNVENADASNAANAGTSNAANAGATDVANAGVSDVVNANPSEVANAGTSNVENADGLNAANTGASNVAKVNASDLSNSGTSNVENTVDWNAANAGASNVVNANPSDAVNSGTSNVETTDVLNAADASASNVANANVSEVATANVSDIANSGTSNVGNSGASNSTNANDSNATKANTSNATHAGPWIETGTMDFAGALPAQSDLTATSSSSSVDTTPSADIATALSASVPDMQNRDTELQFHSDHFNSEQNDKTNHSQNHRLNNRKNGRRDRNNRNGNHSSRSVRASKPKQNNGQSFERHGSLKSDFKSSASLEQVSYKSLVKSKKQEKKKNKKANRDLPAEPRVEIDPAIKTSNEEFYTNFTLSVEKAIYILNNKINDIIEKGSFTEEEFQYTKTAMEYMITKLDRTYKWMRVTHAAMRLDSELPTWSSEYASLQSRRDMCFTQALTTLITGLFSWANTTPGEIVHKLITSGLGPLCEFEGLLSLYAAEKTMWGDMVVAIEDLHTVVFRLEKVTPGSFKMPQVSGSRNALVVDIPVSYALYERFERSQVIPMFTITAVFFNVGINEKASVAEALGETRPQHYSNNDNLDRLTKYYQKYTKVFPNDPLVLMKASSRSKPLGEVIETLRRTIQKRASKNVEILQQAALATRLMNGIRFTSCKSAKDRTGMAVTLEQCGILSSEYHLADHDQKKALDIMRSEGARRANTLKNIGLSKYAFTKKQVHSLPEEYRPPQGSYGATFT